MNKLIDYVPVDFSIGALIFKNINDFRGLKDYTEY